jgi:hypothetical protein
MGIFKGGALRLLQTLLYALAFCCAGIVLGIFSYFLAVLADRDLHIAAWKKAVEGMSGAAVLYTIATTLLTCCLAGITFLSLLGLVLDLCFMGCFIAIAVLCRHGAHSCKGYVRTPLGNGPANRNLAGYGANGFGLGNNENSTYAPDLGFACRLNTAVFAVSIAAAVLFFITALMQLALMRHHKKEKKFGPSPANDYTSGSEKKSRGMFARKNKTAPVPVHADEAVIGTQRNSLPAATTIRPSHDTAYSGHTAVGGTGQTVIQKEGLTHDGLHAPHVGWNPHSDNHDSTAYHTGPVGTTTVPANGVARDF